MGLAEPALVSKSPGSCLLQLSGGEQFLNVQGEPGVIEEGYDGSERGKIVENGHQSPEQTIVFDDDMCDFSVAQYVADGVGSQCVAYRHDLVNGLA